MIKLDHERFAAINQRHMDRFTGRLTDHLTNTWPGLVARMGKEQFSLSVSQGIAAASAHGFDSEQDVARYVNLLLVWGEKFGSEKGPAWPLPILADQRLSSALKIHQLCARSKLELNALDGIRQEQ